MGIFRLQPWSLKREWLRKWWKISVLLVEDESEMGILMCCLRDFIEAEMYVI